MHLWLVSSRPLNSYNSHVDHSAAPHTPPLPTGLLHPPRRPPSSFPYLSLTDSMLDQPPRLRDGPIITPTVAKSIVGQAALQLSVMAALLGPLGESLTHTAAAADAAAVTDAAVAAVAAGGAAAAAVMSGVGGVDVVGGAERIEQYTLVFNSFVLMQLFNQVRVFLGGEGGMGDEGWGCILVAVQQVWHSYGNLGCCVWWWN